MSAAAVATQIEADVTPLVHVAPVVIDVMMELTNVEASLGDFYSSDIEERLDLYDRREKLVARLLCLGATDVLERAYGWAD